MAEPAMASYPRVVGPGVQRAWVPQGHVNINCRVSTKLYSNRQAEIGSSKTNPFPGLKNSVPAVEAFELVFSEPPSTVGVRHPTDPEVFTDWTDRSRPTAPVFVGVGAAFTRSTDVGGIVAVTRQGAVSLNHRGPTTINLFDSLYWIYPTMTGYVGQYRQNAVHVHGTNEGPIRAVLIGVPAGVDPAGEIAKYEAEFVAKKAADLGRPLADLQDALAAAGANPPDYQALGKAMAAVSRGIATRGRYVGQALCSCKPGQALHVLLE